MTSDVRDWLPANALIDGPLPFVIGAAVDGWRKRWFLESVIKLSGGEALRGTGGSVTDPSWRSFGAEFALRCDRPMALRLAKLALAMKREDHPFNDVDGQVAFALANRLIEDFAQSFARITGLGAAAASGPAASIEGVRFDLLDGRDRVAEIALSTAAAIRLSKSRLGEPVRPTGAYGDLAEALGSGSTIANVELGEAKLSLTELRSLAPGDVIVLDRSVKAGARLTTRVGRQELAQGAISVRGGALALTLHGSGTAP